MARHRLHETVNNLNRGLSAGTIRFHVYGNCVWWERLPPSGEGDAG